MPTSPNPITPLPTPVPTSADPTTFDARADAFLAALPDFATENNDAAQVTYDNALEAFNSAAAADASASIASSASGAAVWNAATSYAPYQSAISPITYQTYRREPPGGVDATDPSASADWVLIGLDPDEYAQTAGATFTGNVNLPSINNGPVGGYKNLIINGNHFVPGRVVSGILDRDYPTLANNANLSVCWNYLKSGAYVNSANGTNDETAFFSDATRLGIFNRLSVNTQTAVVSPGTTDYVAIEHRMESCDAAVLEQQTFTLSFYVRSVKTGVHCVSFANDANTRSYVAEYTVNASQTWERKTITVSGGLPASEVGDGQGWILGTEGAIGLRTRFCLSSGTGVEIAAGAWEAGNYFATSNQVNVCDATDSTGLGQFAITGVQIELGSIATTFERVDITKQYQMAARYFELLPSRILCYAAAGASFGSMCYYKVLKAKTPTYTFSSTAFTNASTVVAGTPSTRDGVFVTASATALGMASVTTTVSVDARL